LTEENGRAVTNGMIMLNNHSNIVIPSTKINIAFTHEPTITKGDSHINSFAHNAERIAMYKNPPTEIKKVFIVYKVIN
jgi:hypothetical protein